MTRRRRYIPALFALLLASAAAIAAAGNASAVGATSVRSDVALLVAYVLLALVFSFLCSVAEAVLLSVTPSFIAGLRDRKPKLAVLLTRLKQENVDQSLAAILTLNTVAHTVGAIGAGAEAAVVFGMAWVGIVSAVMTLLILFLSEIVPKTLGAVLWRSLAGPTAHFVRGLIVLLYPLIKVSEGLTRFIAHGREVHLFSREEFVALAREGQETGHIGADEFRIIRNLFRFESLRATDIMTPRTVMQTLQQDMTAAQALELVAGVPFSRLPLYGEDADDITGYVFKSDLLLSKAEGYDDAPLRSLKRELATVVPMMPLSNLLEFLLWERQHMALVIDEYGGTKGLVTLEDVVETLLGMQIVDEMGTTEDMQALARRQWARRIKALGLEADFSEDGLAGERPPPGPDHAL